MSEQVFCNVENRPFDESHFASGPDGTTIHVLTETSGHTLDGWIATFSGQLTDGRWVLGDVTIKEPVIERYAEIAWNHD